MPSGLVIGAVTYRLLFLNGLVSTVLYIKGQNNESYNFEDGQLNNWFGRPRIDPLAIKTDLQVLGPLMFHETIPSLSKN